MIPLITRTTAWTLFAIATAGTVLGYTLTSSAGLALLGAVCLEHARIIG